MSKWKNNAVQFPRLIAELEAAGAFTDEVMQTLAESMDLTQPEICELIERAQSEFDQVKATT